MAGIVKNSLLSAASGAATLLGGLISTILVARLMGVQATGAVAYALWLATMGVTLLDGGAQATLARYMPQLRATDPRGADAFAVALFPPYAAVTFLAVGAAGATAALRGASPLGGTLGLAAVAALCLAQSFANFGLGELRGRQAFDTAARLTLLSMLLQIALVVLGGALFGVVGVIIGYVAGAAPLALRALRMLRARGAGGVTLLGRGYGRFAFFAWAGGLASALVWSRSEVFFLQRSCGTEAVALLTAGLTFANLAAQGPLLLTGALLPFFSEKIAVDRAAVDRAFASGTRILAFLALPLCFGAAGVMPGLVQVVFGPHFAGASLPGAIVVIAAGLAAPGAVGTHVMYARDRSDFLFVSNTTGALLSVLAGFVVIPRFGLMGAACSRAAIQTALVLWGFGFISWRLRCPTPFAHLARLALSAALCGAAAFATLSAGPFALTLAPAVIVGGLVYFAGVRAFGALAPEDLERLGALAQALPGALRWAPETLVRWLASKRPLTLAGRHV